MENKEIFKVGDEVYYYSLVKGCLKGELIAITNDNSCNIRVVFCDGVRTFTTNGSFIDGQLPNLSFAPYDFINGGFTQERPLPKIELDTLVYVKYYFNCTWWQMAYFSHFSDGVMYVFCDQKKSGEIIETLSVIEWSLLNPLEQ